MDCDVAPDPFCGPDANQPFCAFLHDVCPASLRSHHERSCHREGKERTNAPGWNVPGSQCAQGSWPVRENEPAGQLAAATNDGATRMAVNTAKAVNDARVIMFVQTQDCADKGRDLWHNFETALYADPHIYLQIKVE